MPFPILSFLHLGYSASSPHREQSLSLLLIPLLHCANSFVLWVCIRAEHHPCSLGSLGCNKSLQHRAEQHLGCCLHLLDSPARVLGSSCSCLDVPLCWPSSHTPTPPLELLTGTWSSFQQPPIIQRMSCCSKASL